jgi:integrase
VVDQKGRPFKVDNFRHRFREAVVNCGLDGLTFHGLRKKATEMLAEAGCTDREIMAITGHKTHSMVCRYLDRAKQRERARSAIRKLEDKSGN